MANYDEEPLSLKQSQELKTLQELLVREEELKKTIKQTEELIPKLEEGLKTKQNQKSEEVQLQQKELMILKEELEQRIKEQEKVIYTLREPLIQQEKNYVKLLDYHKQILALLKKEQKFLSLQVEFLIRKSQEDFHLKQLEDDIKEHNILKTKLVTELLKSTQEYQTTKNSLIQDIPKLNSELRKKEQLVTSLEQEKKDIIAALNKKEEEIAMLQNIVDKLRVELDTQRKHYLDEIQNINSTLQKEITVLNNALEEKKKYISELEQINKEQKNNLITLKQELKRNELLITELKSIDEPRKKNIEKLKQDLTLLEKKLLNTTLELEKFKHAFEEKQKQMDVLLQRLEEQRNIYETELAYKNDEIKRIQTEKMKDFELSQEQIATLSKELVKVKQNQGTELLSKEQEIRKLLNMSNKQLSEKQEQINILTKHIEEIKNLLSTKNNELEEKNRELTEKQNQINNLIQQLNENKI